ncbi:MAG: hypothetical protein QM601_08225 [Pseudoxanthomonas sp.]
MTATRKPAARAASALRRRLADEAARLVLDERIDSPRQALRKAAARLGVGDPSLLPEPAEVEQAVHERLRLFAATPVRSAALRSLRRAAAEAMAFLAPFQPRLAGAVLDGTADPASPVQLHLHADDPDEVARLLQDQGIPARARDRRLRLHAHAAPVPVPGWTFAAGEVAFELLVLPASSLRQPPPDADGQHPLARANLARVRALIETPDS